MEKHIAIIDDEVEVLDTLKRFLEKNENYHVDIFSNPEEAMENIKVRNYDLLLLDIMMPTINGLDVLKEIKGEKENIKVIMMTAYSTLNTTLKSDTYGADAYLEKPFPSLLSLKTTVDELLA
jgi:DNA-binding response OmpR family regulator